jgi:hypothetical protein
MPPIVDVGCRKGIGPSIRWGCGALPSGGTLRPLWRQWRLACFASQASATMQTHSAVATKPEQISHRAAKPALPPPRCLDRCASSSACLGWVVPRTASQQRRTVVLTPAAAQDCSHLSSNNQEPALQDPTTPLKAPVHGNTHTQRHPPLTTWRAAHSPCSCCWRSAPPLPPPHTGAD